MDPALAGAVCERYQKALYPLSMTAHCESITDAPLRSGRVKAMACVAGFSLMFAAADWAVRVYWKFDTLG